MVLLLVLAIEISDFRLQSGEYYKPNMWNKAFMTISSPSDVELIIKVSSVGGPTWYKKINMLNRKEISTSIPVTIASDRVTVTVGNIVKNYTLKQPLKNQKIVFKDDDYTINGDNLIVFKIQSGEKFVESADIIVSNHPERYTHFFGQIKKPAESIEDNIQTASAKPFQIEALYKNRLADIAIKMIIGFIAAIVVLSILIKKKYWFPVFLSVQLIFVLAYLFLFPKVDTVCHSLTIKLYNGSYNFSKFVSQSGNDKQVTFTYEKITKPYGSCSVDVDAYRYTSKLPVSVETTMNEAFNGKCKVSNGILFMEFDKRLYDVKLFYDGEVYELGEAYSGEQKLDKSKKGLLSDVEAGVIDRFSKGKPCIIGREGRLERLNGGLSPEILETIIYPSYVLITVNP